MSRLSLNDEMNIEVRVLLIAKGTDEPITSKEYSVRLFDKDVFNDDFLGESSPDADGRATFVIRSNILKALQSSMKNRIFILWYIKIKKKFLKAGS